MDWLLWLFMHVFVCLLLVHVRVLFAVICLWVDAWFATFLIYMDCRLMAVLKNKIKRERERGDLYVYIYIYTRTHTWTRTADAGLGREKCVDPGAGPSRLGVPSKNSVHYVTSLDVKAPKCSDVEYCWIVSRSVAVSSVSVLYWEQLARAPVSPDGLDISTGRPQAGHMQSAM